ncbi:Na-translocating system protein MpsC family protein [Marinococcus halophilus]|uniref:Na-translocating system protein MpsC family protein n=1 Tax=Marinococcus halophilus TaxID=1371 RepID=UPI0009A5F87C|nr:Na-translocating system protein MpsC family protein [Marinococcus halophilus]
MWEKQFESEKWIKQQIAQLYNRVNQEMYEVGVKTLKVELLQNKCIIFAEHKRVPALRALEQGNRALAEQVDAALVDEFKKRLHHLLVKEMELPVRTVLKDFDPASGAASTVIYLNEKER